MVLNSNIWYLKLEIMANCHMRKVRDVSVHAAVACERLIFKLKENDWLFTMKEKKVYDKSPNGQESCLYTKVEDCMKAASCAIKLAKDKRGSSA